MRLTDLPTPCLLLEPSALARNVAAMNAAVSRHPGVRLRQHVKTAKCAEVAELAGRGHGRAITVSTLAEAEAFAAAGFDDILYAVGILPSKVPRLLASRDGVTMGAIVDSAELVPELSRAVPEGAELRLSIELDVGQHRGGVSPDGESLLAIASAIAAAPNLKLVGVLAHAGQSYDAASVDELRAIAEAERSQAVFAADRLRKAGFSAPSVSVGSTPTALFAQHLEGVTEVRAGVYVFQDLFQASLGCAPKEDIAVSVLASVIGVRGDDVLIDAGGIALSKDRSMDGRGGGYGEVRRLDLAPLGGLPLGGVLPGGPIVHAVNQEHGFVRWPKGHAVRVGDRVRVLPNHVCMTAAQHANYHVVDGLEVTAYWPRVSGF